MKLGIVGSRKFTDWKLFQAEMARFIDSKKVTKVISGGAEGADTMAEQWADRNNINFLPIYPKWRQYGRKAGFIRNGEIVRESDIIIAFWDGHSHGTQDTINKAKIFKRPTFIVYV